jgi:V8-like Glu-specific endopeptidase
LIAVLLTLVFVAPAHAEPMGTEDTYQLTATTTYAYSAVDTQWCSDDQVRAADAYQVFYANDTAPRMSGSPVMEWTGSAWNVVAIHTMGVHGTAYNHCTYNHGTRITSTVANDLYNWQYYG